MARTDEELVGALRWQPLETAPKDDTKILGYRASAFGPLYAVISWYEPGGWWMDDQICTKDYFSHWMPLPEPPK